MPCWICLRNTKPRCSKWRLRCRILLHWRCTNHKPYRPALRRSLPKRIFLPCRLWIPNSLLSRLRLPHEWNLSSNKRSQMHCGLLLPSRCQKHHTCFNEHGLGSHLPSRSLLCIRYLESLTVLTWYLSC